MNKFLSIQDAVKCLGVSPQTLRRWEGQKKSPLVIAHRVADAAMISLKLQSFNCRDKTSNRL